ncbi:MAG: HAMP domain-containing protein, partial [Nitriliruptorales bacterium]|nr:HAMP domain-containing protein [Nitriliruptorales bacterium]
LDRDPELIRQWATIETPQLGTLQRPEVGRIIYHAVPLRIDGDTRGVFVSAWFRDLEAAEINEIVRLNAGIGLVVLLFASAIVWNVTSRVMRPVREVADTARTITETDLTQRIATSGDDEIGQLAATFNAMLDRLEAAFATQRQFVDDAGHELRTPITIVRGHLELLEYGDAADREQTVALVLDELDRMNRLVDDLLLLAKFQRPDFLHLDGVDLAVLTQEMLDKASALGDRHWELETAGDAVVVADRQRLTQAVVQLAQNAVQHTEDGQHITLGSSVADGVLRLWVRDTGPGVSEADRERIFERFARADGAPAAMRGRASAWPSFRRSPRPTAVQSNSTRPQGEAPPSPSWSPPRRDVSAPPSSPRRSRDRRHHGLDLKADRCSWAISHWSPSRTNTSVARARTSRCSPSAGGLATAPPLEGRSKP